jgi:hypothetical protein
MDAALSGAITMTIFGTYSWVYPEPGPPWWVAINRIYSAAGEMHNTEACPQDAPPCLTPQQQGLWSSASLVVSASLFRITLSLPCSNAAIWRAVHSAISLLTCWRQHWIRLGSSKQAHGLSFAADCFSHWGPARLHQLRQLLRHEPLNGSVTTSWPPTAMSTRAWQRVLIV